MAGRHTGTSQENLSKLWLNGSHTEGLGVLPLSLSVGGCCVGMGVMPRPAAATWRAVQLLRQQQQPTRARAGQQAQHGNMAPAASRHTSPAGCGDQGRFVCRMSSEGSTQDLKGRRGTFQPTDSSCQAPAGPPARHLSAGDLCHSSTRPGSMPATRQCPCPQPDNAHVRNQGWIRMHVTHQGLLLQAPDTLCQKMATPYLVLAACL